MDDGKLATFCITQSDYVYREKTVILGDRFLLSHNFY